MMVRAWAVFLEAQAGRRECVVHLGSFQSARHCSNGRKVRKDKPKTRHTPVCGWVDSDRLEINPLEQSGTHCYSCGWNTRHHRKMAKRREAYFC